MIPSDLEMRAKLDEFASMDALFVLGLKEHPDKSKMQCRLFCCSDELTPIEKLFYARVLASISYGLSVMGPPDMAPKAFELLSLAHKLVEDADKERANA